MFRSETHRCLERALAQLVRNGDSGADVTDARLSPDQVGRFAERLANQLWLDGYELDPVQRISADGTLLVEQLVYD